MSTSFNYLSLGTEMKNAVVDLSQKVSICFQLWCKQSTSDSLYCELYQKNVVLPIHKILDTLISYTEGPRQSDLVRFLSKKHFSLIKCSDRFINHEGLIEDCWMLIGRKNRIAITLYESHVLSFLETIGSLPLRRAYRLGFEKKTITFRKIDDVKEGTRINDYSWKTNLKSLSSLKDVITDASLIDSFIFRTTTQRGIHLSSPCSSIEPVDFREEDSIMRLDEICTNNVLCQVY